MLCPLTAVFPIIIITYIASYLATSMKNSIRNMDEMHAAVQVIVRWLTEITLKFETIWSLWKTLTSPASFLKELGSTSYWLVQAKQNKILLLPQKKSTNMNTSGWMSEVKQRAGQRKLHLLLLYLGGGEISKPWQIKPKLPASTIAMDTCCSIFLARWYG